MAKAQPQPWAWHTSCACMHSWYARQLLTDAALNGLLWHEHNCINYNSIQLWSVYHLCLYNSCERLSQDTNFSALFYGITYTWYNVFIPNWYFDEVLSLHAWYTTQLFRSSLPSLILSKAFPIRWQLVSSMLLLSHICHCNRIDIRQNMLKSTSMEKNNL